MFLLNIFSFSPILLAVFSTGQKYFSLFFIIAFVALMIWAYRKDAVVNKIYYKNSWKILVSVLAILAALVWIINHTR